MLRVFSFENPPHLKIVHSLLSELSAKEPHKGLPGGKLQGKGAMWPPARPSRQASRPALVGEGK